jgi:hypothetical protein
MKAMVIRSGDTEPMFEDILPTMEGLQALVGGYFEHIPHSQYYVIVNEDGQHLDLPVNRLGSIMLGRQIVGTVVVTGLPDGRGELTPIE